MVRTAFPFVVPAGWKPATQRTWKSALRGPCADAPNGTSLPAKEQTRLDAQEHRLSTDQSFSWYHEDSFYEAALGFTGHPDLSRRQHRAGLVAQPAPAFFITVSGAPARSNHRRRCPIERQRDQLPTFQRTDGHGRGTGEGNPFPTGHRRRRSHRPGVQTQCGRQPRQCSHPPARAAQ